MKITLTQEQYEELNSLEEGMVLEIDYHGIDAYITPDQSGNIEYRGRKYLFNFICPSEVTLHVKKSGQPKKADAEAEQAADGVKIIAAEFDPKKMHVYDVKTSGKHPVRLIDGGAYITEDERDLSDYADMGWYWLNSKEYAYFKSQCKEIVLR